VTHVHHSAICVRDLAASLRFYRDGVGLAVLMDHVFDGAWPELFDAPSNRLRSVFLGDPATPDAGVVELVDIEGGLGEGSAPGAVRNGFFLLSFFVDLEQVVARLADLGYGELRRIEQPAPGGSVAMATLFDPDGVRIELIDIATR
jgi:catechol 2,3-dioxygenase-like lactoylglutathione lyase family enzyme